MANGDATITIPNTGGLEVGMGIQGTGIPDDTFVLSITSATAFEMSKNASATYNSGTSPTSQTLTFGNVDFTTDIETSRGDGKKYDEGTTFHVIQTTGTFQKGETITSNITQSASTMTNFSAGTDGEAILHSVTSPLYYSMADAHAVYSKGEQNTGYDYRADICLLYTSDAADE